ncbi:CRP/FNR family transcriptional regulator, anaerobic regulatory protein [Albimonas pacifica]|uniref:CRP/FNR family transcriptional regulator, anaerobic regulatory protein n=2 Tax=Albimonas pacifica TaxID=1114924 RepID=A0A1I3LQS7_9RHOB|nr:CRP/FNR family transcriptional regulator, anaerobic regulatory protein [Albimonas pacifica]
MKAMLHAATTGAPDIRARGHCLDCAIRQHAVCSDCSAPELDFLTNIKTYKSYKAGDRLLEMGERAAFMGTVVEGVASMSRILSDGRRQVVGLLFPGDLVGRPFSPVSPFDYVAVTDLRVCAFNRPQFETTLRETPALEQRLLEMTLDELDSAREWMVLLGRKSAQEKLCSFMIMAAQRALRLERRRPMDGILIELPLTREDMADFLGLTIETVSRQIGALKKSGVIELIDARHLLIPSWEALEEAAGGELAAV